MEQLKQLLGGLPLDTVRTTTHSEEDVVSAWYEVADGCKFQLTRRTKRNV